MAKQTKVVRAWAVVTARGRVQVDTVSVDRESAEYCLSLHDEEAGNKVRRVAVMYEMPKRKDKRSGVMTEAYHGF